IGRGLGISLEQAGFLVSARSLAGIATPAVVSVVGRGERRVRLIVAGLAFFVTGTALTAATNAYLGALIGFVLLGVAKPVFDISAQSYLADRTPYARRARYLSVLELTWAGSLLVGAPAAGWLIGRLGWQAPFWALAGLGALSLWAVSWVLEADHHVETGQQARLRLDRSAAVLLVVVGLFTLAAEVTIVVFGAWLEDEFALSLVALGGAATLIALAELTGEGTTLAFADRIGKRRTVALGLTISVAAFASLGPLSSSLGWGLGAMAIAFAGFELTIVSTIPLATEVLPAARARFLALLMVAVALARAAGAAVGPALFAWQGLGANTYTSAGTGLVALLLLLGLVEERAHDRH
ncbi:MAG: MFS transporter, partial [Acidimicrobiia bacterium]